MCAWLVKLITLGRLAWLLVSHSSACCMRTEWHHKMIRIGSKKIVHRWSLKLTFVYVYSFMHAVVWWGILSRSCILFLIGLCAKGTFGSAEIGRLHVFICIKFILVCILCAITASRMSSATLSCRLRSQRQHTSFSTVLLYFTHGILSTQGFL